MTELPSLARALNLRHPIVQAPMAGVSTPELAAEVCRAGGMGSLGLGAMTPEAARAAIRQARALGATCLNANVFCHAPAQADPRREAAWLTALAPEFARFKATPPAEISEIYTSFLADQGMQQMLLEEAPEVVSFHFGLPDAEVIAALKGAGCRLFASATSRAEAEACLSAGMEAIVVQGIEAGGHRGCFDPDPPDTALPMMDLLAALRPLTDLPLIAAGGLMDGADCAKALQAGADLVQLGTAFVLCPESSADAGYRAALSGDLAADTALTRAISGRPARGLRNAFVRWGEDRPAASVPDYPRCYDAGKALHAAAKAAGNHGFGAHWAGTGAPRARTLPAAQLMSTLVAELRVAL